MTERTAGRLIVFLLMWRSVEGQAMSEDKWCKIKNCLDGNNNCSNIYQECTRDRETCCAYGCCVNTIGLNYKAAAISLQVISLVLCCSTGWAFLHAVRKLRKANATLRDMSYPQASTETFAPTVFSYGPSHSHNRGSDGLLLPLDLELSKSLSSEVCLTGPPPPSLVSQDELDAARVPTYWSRHQNDPSFPDFGSTDPPSLLEMRCAHGTLMSPELFSTPVSWKGDWPQDDQSMTSPSEEHQPGQLTLGDGKVASPASLEVLVPIGNSFSSNVVSAPASLMDFPMHSEHDSENLSHSSSITLQGPLFAAIAIPPSDVKNQGKK